MKPIDFVVIGIILLIVGAASLYLVKAKKSGKKCIGCPYASSCSSKCSCGNATPKNKTDDK